MNVSLFFFLVTPILQKLLMEPAFTCDSFPSWRVAASTACLQPQFSLRSSVLWGLVSAHSASLLASSSLQTPAGSLLPASVFFSLMLASSLLWVRLSLVQACPLPPWASHTCIHLQTAFQREPFFHLGVPQVLTFHAYSSCPSVHLTKKPPIHPPR